MRIRKLLCLVLAAAIMCTSLPAMGVQAQEVQTKQVGQEMAALDADGGNGVFEIEDGMLVGYKGAGEV